MMWENADRLSRLTLVWMGEVERRERSGAGDECKGGELCLKIRDFGVELMRMCGRLFERESL